MASSLFTIAEMGWSLRLPVRRSLREGTGKRVLIMAKKFSELSERDILALAISLEEEDGRVYADFADGLRETYPDTAKIFDEMREEESQHRASLIDTYRSRFGEHIPLIRRHDVKGLIQRRPVWLVRPLRIDDVRKQVEVMEFETRRFYERAIQHVSDTRSEERRV